MRLNEFSVIKTKIKKKKINEKIFLKKKLVPNIKKFKNKININYLYTYTKNYYLNIQNSKIDIPKISKFEKKSNSIECIMEFKGKNLIEQGLNIKNFSSFSKQIKSILKIIKLAKINKIEIDPHIKNFVFENSSSKAYYVDIFPPYNQDFHKLRKKYYITEDEKYICEKNFEFFKPYNLFYHFVSDLIKLDKKFNSKINFLYNELSKSRLIKSDKVFFKKKVNFIKKIELERIKKKYYLV